MDTKGSYMDVEGSNIFNLMSWYWNFSFYIFILISKSNFIERELIQSPIHSFEQYKSMVLNHIYRVLKWSNLKIFSLPQKKPCTY